MNEIKLKVNFGKRTCVKSGISLTTGDYNSTKIIFEFDREDGTKIFEMKNPNNEIIFVDEIVNNEVILVGQADITTKHNDVIYIKYADDNETTYWYDSELDKLYDNSFVEVQNISLDELTKITENASLFTMAGRYTFEISLYDGDSKLTSKSDYLDVKEEQVVINNNMVSLYLPVFDRLIGELDNLDIDVNKSGGTTTVTLNRKDGTSKTVQVLDGIDGQDGVNGQDGRDGTDGQDGITPTIGNNGNWYLGETDTGKPSRGIQGENGQDGQDGQDGYTPVKGVDYFTTQDISSIESDILNDIEIPTKLSDLTDDLGSNPTHTHSQYLTTHQDISGKQNIEDNTLNTNNKTVPSAINEVNSIAKGANQALSYSNYQAMITAFNSLANNVYNVGQNVMIITLNVPDLWISGIENTDVPYTYTSDSDFTNALATNGYVQVGYYKLSALETQKVDLTNYVQFTDYATSNKAGVVKTANGFAINNGTPYANSRTYNQYLNDASGFFIGKSTLENVLTGKNLETANNKVTSISSSSTDTQYPSAKCVYDYIQALDGDEVNY